MKKTPGSPGVFYLWVEFAALFGGVPLLILYERRPALLFLALWGGGVVLYRASRPAVPPPPPSLHTILRRLAMVAPFRIGLALLFVPTTPSPFDTARQRQTRAILLRFLLLGLLLTWLTRVFAPSAFLQFPLQHFWIWLLTMLVYPLLSVWPQEVIYRRFLLQRYVPLFGTAAGFIAASALAFGFAHVIFLSWITVALTFAGGVIVGHGYTRHHSLSLCCFEHTLYGCLIFTIGLGRYFYTGTTWH